MGVEKSVTSQIGCANRLNGWEVVDDPGLHSLQIDGNLANRSQHLRQQLDYGLGRQIVVKRPDGGKRDRAGFWAGEHIHVDGEVAQALAFRRFEEICQLT